ncbi:MAG: sulfite exporter TauE/SafE family protein [Pirellulales bacterium]
MMSLDPFLLVVFVVAFVAGGIASISGFGIGSLLTPLLGVQIGFKLAVAVVSIPHLIGTAVRFFTLRQHVDRRLLIGFGLTSAAGGLTGALLHTFVKSPILTAVFGLLLVFAGVTGLLGLAERMRFGGVMGWIAGAVSGLLGGLVGNQGGIRSAALLGFDVPKHSFLATATAIGLIVDGARMPVYLFTEGQDMLAEWPAIVAASVGVVAGTFAGYRLFKRFSETLFRKIVSAIVLALGLVMLFRFAREVDWL